MLTLHNPRQPVRRRLPSLSCPVGLVGFLVFMLAAQCAAAAEHPRLLVRAADLPRIRAAAAGGEGAADAAALAAWLAQPRLDTSLHGELLAAAAMHLVGGDAAGAALGHVAAALREPPGVAHDALEAVVALDWCWGALDAGTRAEVLLELRRRAKPLAPGESPLEPLVFRERLAAVALALVLEGEPEAKEWEAERREILEAAKVWMSATLPRFVEWRGRTPTSSAAAAAEESDTILAIELGGQVLGQSLWPRYRASVGRWMEHYVYALSTGSAAPPFVHDDGQAGALLPVATWSGLQPVSAHLLAARTRDPSAALLADRVAAAMRGGAPRSAALWRWATIFFDFQDVPRCDEERLPPLRDLGGALALRTSAGGRPAVIRVEGTQPILRRRQHFDAGSFQVYCGGLLAVEGGDDIALEATPARGGMQRLGEGKDEFAFEQYFVSTIAHNAMVFWEQTAIARWYGEPFVAIGGQRPVEGTLADFSTAVENTPRHRGRLLACGWQAGDAYAALDLGPGYDARVVRSYTREFILVDGGVLLVVDRATLASDRAFATFVLNLPERPSVDGEDLAAERRINGEDNQGGVWTCDDAGWIRCGAKGGAMFVRPLLPSGARVFVVGGPAATQSVEAGPCKGRRYVGGSAKSFERLVVPSGRRNARNAWYRLGTPNTLGPELERLRHWGRVEIEPAAPGERPMFVTAIVLSGDASAARPPIDVRRADSENDALVVECKTPSGAARILLNRGSPSGRVVRGEQAWPFPESAEADGPLPIR